MATACSLAMLAVIVGLVASGGALTVADSRLTEEPDLAARW